MLLTETHQGLFDMNRHESTLLVKCTEIGYTEVDMYRIGPCTENDRPMNRNGSRSRYVPNWILYRNGSFVPKTTCTELDLSGIVQIKFGLRPDTWSDLEDRTEGLSSLEKNTQIKF